VVVKWSKPALNQLDKALDFIIGEGFISYAAKLEESIISRIENLDVNAWKIEISLYVLYFQAAIS
jgi:hypothetical protein